MMNLPTDDAGARQTLIAQVLQDVPDLAPAIRHQLKLPPQKRHQIRIQNTGYRYLKAGGAAEDILVALIGLLICRGFIRSAKRWKDYSAARNLSRNCSDPTRLSELEIDTRLKTSKALVKTEFYLTMALHARLGKASISAPVISLLMPIFLASQKDLSELVVQPGGDEDRKVKLALLNRFRRRLTYWQGRENNLRERAEGYLNHLVGAISPNLIASALTHYSDFKQLQRPPKLRFTKQV